MFFGCLQVSRHLASSFEIARHEYQQWLRCDESTSPQSFGGLKFSLGFGSMFEGSKCFPPKKRDHFDPIHTPHPVNSSNFEGFGWGFVPVFRQVRCFCDFLRSSKKKTPGFWGFFLGFLGSPRWFCFIMSQLFNRIPTSSGPRVHLPASEVLRCAECRYCTRLNEGSPHIPPKKGKKWKSLPSLKLTASKSTHLKMDGWLVGIRWTFTFPFRGAKFGPKFSRCVFCCSFYGGLFVS